ncbi:MAG: ATP-binding protein [Thermodesulfobacteriota bacterium]
MERTSEEHRILLIEDEPVMMGVLVDLLQSVARGACQVLPAACLAAGLEVLRRVAVDLVLLDLSLPDSAGLATLSAVLAAAPEVAVVVLTGLDDQDLARRAIQAGAQDYLVKGQADGRQITRALAYARERRRILASLQQRNEELAQARAQLEKALVDLKDSQVLVLQQEKMASIGQLAAGIAHEINNPVGFITSNLNTLQRYLARLSELVALQSAALAAEAPRAGAALGTKRQEWKIDMILEDAPQLIAESLDGAERVRRIVQELRTFARRDQAEEKEADLNQVVEGAIAIAWNELKYKATLVRELGELPPVRCHYQQLGQVVMNLLLNAVQAIESQGEICVRTWREGDFVCIAVQDTGCGIPREHLDRIFEPFFTTKEVGKGTGLGLSIVYNVVHKHEGTIDVDSRVGEGTTFTVRLPIRAADPARIDQDLIGKAL